MLNDSTIGDTPIQTNSYLIQLQNQKIEINLEEIRDGITKPGAGYEQHERLETRSEVTPPVTVHAGLDLASKYIWRGYNLADEFTIQPYADIRFNKLPLSLNIWGSAGLEERSRLGSADELDLTLSYSPKVNSWATFSLGFIYYIFPTQENFTFADHTSKEVFAGLSFEKVWLSPSITMYRDFDLGDDFYAELGLEQKITVDGKSISIGTTIAYNDGQFGANPGISHVDVSLSTEMNLGPIAITPRLMYTISTESTINPNNELYLMIGLAR